MGIGDRIRAARRKAGWTQVQLAAAIEVDKSAVAQWESHGSSHKGITTDNLQKVAAALAIPLSELLGEAAENDNGPSLGPRETSLVLLFKKMPRHQQDVMLELFRTTVGLSDGSEPKSYPKKGRSVTG